MSALSLFYAPTLTLDTERITLDGAEAQHLAKSRRMQVDDRVQLGNGCGIMATARLESIMQRGRLVELEIIQAQQEPPVLPEIHLYTAMPKGDRQTTLIEMVTQLGVRAVHPMQTRFSISKANEKTQARWQRYGVEASKQARRAWFPQIDVMQGFQTACEHALNAPSSLNWVLAQGGESVIEQRVVWAQTSRVNIFVGPEGGLSEEEMTQLVSAGAVAIGLGAHILRIETAAVAIIASLNSM